MAKKIDKIRPRETVEIECEKCNWNFWIEALDPMLPNGPFVCYQCSGDKINVKKS